MGEFLGAAVLRVSHQTHAENVSFVDPDYFIME